MELPEGGEKAGITISGSRMINSLNFPGECVVDMSHVYYRVTHSPGKFRESKSSQGNVMRVL